jgi:GrpB-like predicted nucleotidyltransferase (UPF0157 family)
VDEDLELIGGREHRAIEIVDYDPAWVAAFAAQRARIGAALGRRARRIDHIGSTAVPGLAAKPIVDIAVGVVDPDAEGDFLRRLERAGYGLRVREPGHRMLRTPARDVHVHVWEAGGDAERRHLLFRDWLRTDPGDRRRYAEEKRRLAARDWPDMNAYAAAKSAVIAEITARAERWATATAWAPPGSIPAARPAARRHP